MRAKKPRTYNTTRQKQDKFLQAYAEGSSVSGAAKVAGVDRNTVYNWKANSPEFTKRFLEAYEMGNDAIDDEIARRAIKGYQVPVVSAGKLVYDKDGNPLTETRYSDPLLTLLAKSRMNKYKDRQEIDHSVNINVAGAKEALLQKLQALKSERGEAEK